MLLYWATPSTFYPEKEVSIMSRAADELHNQEDARSVFDSLMFFVLLLVILGLAGLIFWAAV